MPSDVRMTGKKIEPIGDRINEPVSNLDVPLSFAT